MYTGSYSINMDAKGRMAVPARLRDSLAELCGGRLVITAHHEDDCLLVYPEGEWQELLPRLQKLPNMNRANLYVQRRMIGNAAELEMDGNGRLLLPPTLRSLAGFEKKLMLVGLGHKFELWSEERWNAQMQAPADAVMSDELQNLSF